MTAPGDFDWLPDPALSALSTHDLPPEAADALRGRCHAALARQRKWRRTAACGAFYGRFVEPAAIAILGGGVLVAALVRAVTVLAGRAT
jgi:hypothetical protein